MACSSATRLSPPNGSWPVINSNASTPKENTSAATPVASPVICSGAQYPSVKPRPVIWVSAVDPSGSTSSSSFAMPKSRRAGAPEAPTTTLDGLMSRCTMSWPCAYSVARHTWSKRPMRCANCGACAPAQSVTGTPSTYSITKYGSPWCVPASNNRAMPGWVRRASKRRSRRKRSTNSVLPKPVRKNLMAA